MHHDNAPTYDACAWVFCQKQNRNHGSTTVFIGIGPGWPFFLSKTKDNDEKKAFCCAWGEKKNIETEAVGDTKKRISEVVQGLKKKYDSITVLYLRGLTLKATWWLLINKWTFFE